MIASTQKYLALCLMVALAPLCALAQTIPPVSQAEADRECDSWPDVPVNITPRFDDPQYEYTIDIRTLQALSGDVTHTVHGSHGELALGLTRYEPILEFSVSVKGVQMSNGLACAHVDKVDVTIGYRNVTVYVPHEVAEGSCGFQQVMTHEQKHIAVNRAILAEYQPILEKKLKDYLRLNGVFKEENPEYAENLLHQHLQSILSDISSQISLENQRRQRDVDNPQEYAKVGGSCQGELRTIGMQYLRGRSSH
jgi:hypothetical protein